MLLFRSGESASWSDTMARDIRGMGVPQITVSYLRSRAARYRQLMASTDDPRHVKRYRERSQLLDEEAELLERQLSASRAAPRLGRS